MKNRNDGPPPDPVGKNQNEEKLYSPAMSRILEIAKYKGIKPTPFFKDLLKWGSDYHNNVVEPSPKKLNILLDLFPEISRAWLFHGEGPMFKLSPNSQNQDQVIPPHDNSHASKNVGTNIFAPPSPELNLVIVPLKVQGGFLRGYENRVFMDQLEYAHFPFIKGRCWLFEVEDFSMSPIADPHDHVVCTEVFDIAWLSKGKIYVIFTTEGKCIKFFDKTDNEFLYLYSENKDYPVKPIPLKSVKKIFFKEYIMKR